MFEGALMTRLVTLLEDLGFDYERFSKSGQQTYDKIMDTVDELTA